MMGLLVFKERMKMVFAKYDMYIMPVVKFGFSLLAMILMNQNIGYMAKLKNPVIPLVTALVCSFMPFSAIAFVMAVFMVMHISVVSFECALITIVFLILIGILYYGFRPRDSYLLVLTPMFFFLKIPYAIPLLVGLSGSLLSIVPVSCGVFIYYVMIYVKQNAGVLTNDASVEITQKYIQVINNLVSNEMMLLMIATFAIGALIVFLIRNLSIDYAWVIAIIAGTVAQLVVIFIGEMAFDVTIAISELLYGIVIAVFVAGIFTFFEFAVDYSRSEYTQFEDDDYYYYVKAVPKMAVSTPDVKVQRINTRKGQ